MLREDPIQKIRNEKGHYVAIRINGNAETEPASYLFDFSMIPSKREVSFYRRVGKTNQERITVPLNGSDITDVIEFENRQILKPVGENNYQLVPIIRVRLGNDYVAEHTERTDLPSESSQVHLG